MNMEAFILGCGGMMPLPYRHLTSVLLRRDGDLFLFDGGEGTQVSLRRLNLKWKKKAFNLRDFSRCQKTQGQTAGYY